MPESIAPLTCACRMCVPLVDVIASVIMRVLVAAGLAVLVVVDGSAAYADPASPQINPVRGGREDARLLGEQLRELDQAAMAPRVVPSPSGEPRQGEPPADAVARLERGAAAYRARDFTRALTELVEASRLAPGWPEPYRLLALAQADSDDCPSALINIDAFAALVPGDPRIPELAAPRDRCLHSGTLRVSSAPTGATIRVDGGPPIGTTSQRLTLPAGLHTVTVEKSGFAPGSQRVEIDPSSVRYASFTLSVARDRPRAQHGWLWVAIGAVATAAAVGVTLMATQGGSDDGGTKRGLPGVTCDAQGCHP